MRYLVNRSYKCAPPRPSPSCAQFCVLSRHLHNLSEQTQAKDFDQERAESESVAVSGEAQDQLLALVKRTIKVHGGEWHSSFSYTFLQQQVECLTTDPRAIHWNPHVLRFFATIQFYGGQKVISLLRGQGLASRRGKAPIPVSSTNIFLPSNSTLRRSLPPVDPYQFVGVQRFDYFSAQVQSMFQKSPNWRSSSFYSGGLVADEIKIRHGMTLMSNI